MVSIMPDKPKKPALRSATWPFILCLVMAIAFVVFFYAFRSSAKTAFDLTVAAIPSVRLFGSGSADTVRGYYLTYGALAGAILGLTYVILGYVLLGLLAIIRLTKQPFGVALSGLLAALPFVWLGYAITNQSNKFTPIATGAVLFIGRPLLYAASVTALFAAVLFVLSFKYGKTA